MEEILRHLNSLWTLSFKNLINVLDILLVAYVIYRLLSLIRGSRAWRIMGGILIFIVALVASSAFGMESLHWVLDKATLLAPVALVILLLPELRQTLEGFGKLRIWTQIAGERSIEPGTIEEIVKAVSYFRGQRIGALIVIELGPPLDSIVSNGIHIDAEVSAPLLESIFYEGNPLHDGAVVIRGDVLVAAACRLPLSDNPRVDAMLHMRHRAALGITEEMDCLAVVVSEERGSIGLARDGHLTIIESPSDLRELLTANLRPESNGKNRKKEEPSADVA
ncbi:MAG TPA: diadenylate cyclase CdaA [Fimbriimonadaceae bacterium]|nr:diadenylate cyclase CdaA [Fimbriimonadaceae bacterium]